MSVKTFAAIDVGSFELTMKIFDFSGKNTMREIDCIRQRIDLGSDTYANGKISNEKMDDLCHTLKEFAQIMESYKVIAYKAYGTSAIRETENTLILQDQIEQRTGIRVEILSNSEQRFLDYKSIASKGETFRRIIEEKTAILDIGGGSIQISLFDKDALVFEDGQLPSVGLVDADKKPFVTLTCTDFPYVGIWSKPDGPYVCLEPWIGRTDNMDFTGDLAEKPGEQKLIANAEAVHTYTIEFHSSI